MKKGLTEIVVIVDRSGSMSGKESDVEGGIKKFVDDQKELPGEAFFTLVEFDDQYNRVYQAAPLTMVRDYKHKPRGTTALLDAIGKTVAEVGQRLASKSEDDRAEKVIVVIVTDGHENASQEYTTAQVKDMVQHQQDKYKWEFVFLGADIDAFASGTTLGFRSVNIANVASDNYGATIATASAATSNMRKYGKATVGGQSVQSLYDEKETS